MHVLIPCLRRPKSDDVVAREILAQIRMGQVGPYWDLPVADICFCIGLSGDDDAPTG
jgi:hypothetical protein